MHKTRGDKRLEMLATNLAGGVNAVAQHVHGSRERTERCSTRLSGQMGATELVTHALQNGIEFGFLAHHKVATTSSYGSASGRSGQEANLPRSIAGGRTHIDPVR